MKIPGVGPAYASRLEKLGIYSQNDFIYHLPSRYDDFSQIVDIKDVKPGTTITIKGIVLDIRNIFTPRGFVLQKATVQDKTGKLNIMWFNQRFLTRVIHKNDSISLSGNIDEKGQMISPMYEIGSSIHTGRFVPIYPETEGVTSKWLRQKISYLLNRLILNDYLDEKTRNEYGLIEQNLAIHKVHFPDNLAQAEAAKKRLAFDEMLMAQLQAKIRKEAWQKIAGGNKFKTSHCDFKLPFLLTEAQTRVIKEIYKDLKKDVPMNRLLQGDVGSGKTIVAAHAIKTANNNGYKAVVMAPTEILALQHYETFKKLGFKTGLVTANNKFDLNSDVLIGTHALLNSKIEIDKLGLVVIDEQHRFGVGQRAKLLTKGVNPHVLTMTATPIPRTIALTLYGDLELSVLDEMPKNRIPVKTWVVPSEKREKAYGWIKNQNTQVFIVCPLIEESESLSSVKAATTEFEIIKNIFPEKKVGLVHGRLKNKDKILNDFRSQKIDILVSTPVIEVGIDIPTANIMVIEGADRFGMAQLHQLRGRVGRGDSQSFCLLFSEKETPRLKYLESINNGMALSEIDLKFRGPGQRFGDVQHGQWDLKIADFSDLDLIEKTGELASDIFKNLDNFSLLQELLTKSKINTASN